MNSKFERMPLTGENILKVLGIEHFSQITNEHLLSLLERGMQVASQSAASTVTHVEYDEKRKSLCLKNNHSDNIFPASVSFDFLKRNNGLIFSIKKEEAGSSGR